MAANVFKCSLRCFLMQLQIMYSDRSTSQERDHKPKKQLEKREQKERKSTDKCSQISHASNYLLCFGCTESYDRYNMTITKSKALCMQCLTFSLSFSRQPMSLCVSLYKTFKITFLAVRSLVWFWFDPSQCNSGTIKTENPELNRPKTKTQAHTHIRLT